MFRDLLRVTRPVTSITHVLVRRVTQRQINDRDLLSMSIYFTVTFLLVRGPYVNVGMNNVIKLNLSYTRARLLNLLRLLILLKRRMNVIIRRGGIQ